MIGPRERGLVVSGEEDEEAGIEGDHCEPEPRKYHPESHSAPVIELAKQEPKQQYSR